MHISFVVPVLALCKHLAAGIGDAFRAKFGLQFDERNRLISQDASGHQTHTSLAVSLQNVS